MNASSWDGRLESRDGMVADGYLHSRRGPGTHGGDGIPVMQVLLCDDENESTALRDELLARFPHLRIIVADADRLARALRFLEEKKAKSRRGGHTQDQDFAVLIEKAPYAIMTTDEAGQLQYVNAAHVKLFGWSARAARGKALRDFFPPSSQPMLATVLTLVARVGGFMGTLFAWRKHDLTPFPLEFAIYRAHPDSAQSGLVAIMQDVSRRFHAEEELRDSQIRLELAMQGSNDGLWDWNLETDEVYYSARWQGILGCLQGDIRGDFAAWTDRVHPDDRDRLQEQMREHLEGKTPFFTLEHRLLHQSGEYRWVLARGVTVRAADGKPYRMAGSLTDLTERKIMEEKELRQHAELAHLLRLSTMGELAASLAHEINQPLAAIVNYARGCQHRLLNRQIENLDDALESIAAQALRIGEIIRRLRAFVRKTPPRRTTCQVNHLVREIMSFVENDARQHGINIELHLAPDLPMVRADAIQIQQVVLNLARNGIEAILEAQSTPKTLRIESWRRGANIEVAVTDSGSGITPEGLAKAFDPFFTTKPAGMGMGLAISRTIISAHGGELLARANDQGGSTFWFTLPLDESSISK